MADRTKTTDRSLIFEPEFVPQNGCTGQEVQNGAGSDSAHCFYVLILMSKHSTPGTSLVERGSYPDGRDSRRKARVPVPPLWADMLEEVQIREKVEPDKNSLVSGKVLCGGQQTLSIQCRGGNLSGERFELRAAENWAGAPLPRFSTMRDAHRPVRFLRVDRPSPSPGVSEMRGPLRRSSSAEEAFLLGSVLGDGLRATDLPREPAGHRSLPPIRDRETLSPGVSRHGGAQHSGRRQRNTRLAHLRRVCPCLD